MGVNDRFDNQIDGQMSIEDLYRPSERLFAISRIFARARKEMTLSEQKTLVYALSEIKFREEMSSPIVYLDKKKLANIVGMKTDSNHLSVDLYNRIKELPRHSFIEISQEDKGLFDSGTVITRVTMLKNRVRIKFEEEYLSLFSGLSRNYITMWTGDIFGMSSSRSVKFYEYLRQNTDTRQECNDIGLGVKALKEMFDIPGEGKGSYLRNNGGFDRANFEKYVVDQVCADLAKTRMITLIVQSDGKYYVKEKRNGKVLGYRFYWTFSAHPAVADAAEVKEIQERVDKDPEVLKVAKDILKGKKRENTKAQKTLHNYMERDPESNVDLYEQIARMDAQRMQTEDD